MFKELLIASHNAGKVKEIGELLMPLGIAVRSAKELALPEPEENGKTFEENAAIKALAAAKASNMAALADDSGICVPALGGAPGIYSARWTGANKSYPDAFQRIMEELSEKGVAAEGAAAYFICVLCLVQPGGEPRYFEGRIDGTLTFPPRGAQGFGYDPIFIPQLCTSTFAEMKAEKKHSMSHRGRAFAKLVEFLRASA